ncbi:MAG TPA: peptide-methionine (R)-S-oxide reductase MsrB [Anaerolineaceae bacterium]|nr:peptide-methionine (R)-S-oxide reductase MsrB [Anaerolineaceae bacterium]
MKIPIIFTSLLILAFVLAACAPAASSTISGQNRETEKEDPMTAPYDPTYNKRDDVEVIYLAGGCFWGLEKLMESIPGVLNAVSGYANGNPGDEPTYSTVSTGKTGYRETVRVEFDPEKVSLDALLFAFFHVIDPTVKNAQGNDIGTQYQTGVYYVDETSGQTVARIADIVRKRYKNFVVEIEPFERFYDAEEYHQNYLDKNPGGYCHISKVEMSTISSMVIDPGKYPRPSDEEIKNLLTENQFRVTQQNGTEPAFQNEYWDNHARGIYVDVVTGEPLFSSSDKYNSGTGWPSFSRGIDENTFFYVVDDSYGMTRTEARSRAGDSHLGHVFYKDPGSPSGTRYCVNSAALRFIPYEEMESQGYGYLLEYVK